VLFEATARRARRVRDTVSPPLYDDHCSLPPFSGRAAEWTRCERYLAGKENPLLFIAGEPGVGKTRLLSEFGSRAFAQGWGVLTARCWRLRAGESFGPLLDLIVRAIRRQTPAERQANLRGCAWLASVLPELVEILPSPVPSWALGREAERRLVTAAITRFLTNMAGPAGTLLLLDDSHLADGDTLELLPHLVRATTDEADSPVIRIIGTYRTTEVDSRTGFMRQLTELMQTQTACHLSLAPLSAVEASALLEHLLPNTGAALRRRSRDQVRLRSGGVPFFLVHCAEQLRLTLDAPEKATLRPECSDVVAEARHRQKQPLPVPWIVAESIRQRLIKLPASGYDAALIVAVAGHPVSDTILLKVLRLAGHTEEQAVSGVEAASHARLLVERAGPVYAFAHPVIGDVVTSNLGAARRMLLRRRFSEACETLEASDHCDLAGGATGSRQ
jgi:hypothetical protein